ncbi:MAG TPA: M48 family metallopeptidase [Candidatus Binataceae bacterium]|nr:M48 family metallopeptidase [Candidatus Binataceae bacterium]
MAIIVILLAGILIAPRSVFCHDEVLLGRMLVGWDIGDLPADPTPQQQIEAGHKQIAVLREDDPGLDSNGEVHDYFNQIVSKLLATADQKPLFPIEVHVSSVPISNAFAEPGGQIVLYEKMFDDTDTEAQLVSVIAHETSHELHNDFMIVWRDYKQNIDVDGPGGVLEQSVKWETAADETGARLMYAAGWDPNGMVELFKRFHKFGVVARHGAPDVRSSHPEEAQRPKLVEALIATLPPKEGLITDSPRFQELKQKY